MPRRTSRQLQRVSRPAPKSASHQFHAVEGETEADQTREAFLKGVGSHPAAQEAVFSKMDRATRLHVISRLQQEHGNAYVQRMLANTSNNRLVQRAKRGSVHMQPVQIEADPVESRRTFARISESIQGYGDNALDYLSIQYLSAMTAFQQWYASQEKADASFFNAVVNLVMNAAWAWGSATVGAVVAPVGSVIMLVAQEAARAIQTSRDDFAASLLQSANNFQSGLQRRLRGKLPEVLQSKDPALWDEVQRRAYLGEVWQPLLHQQGGLPQPGVDYEQRLLADMIFAYRRWELSQHSASYRGVYSMADPDLRHMRGRAEAEGYIQSGQPIPRRLKKYARPGEIIATE